MAKIEIAKLQMAEGFSKVWNYKGIAIALDTPQLTFACDFANMLFTSFFEQQRELAKAKLGMPLPKMQGEIGVAPKEQKSLIVEG
jgi:hypothetical protein